jgi:hypothetical protein
MDTGTGERKIDAKMALRAYQRVVSAGVRNGDEYSLDGLTVSSDFDGYTITLTDGTVTVRVLFHNRVSIAASSGAALEKFALRMNRVAQHSA